MLCDDIRYLMLLTDLHSGITRPFRTMCMDDVRFPVLSHIQLEHSFHHSHPALDIQAYHLGDATLIILVYRQAIHLMFETSIG